VIQQQLRVGEKARGIGDDWRLRVLIHSGLALTDRATVTRCY
jgi:hypothetical protein